ncbi:MAG: tyrosine-type recombinase/integrase, partial [Candidatus Caldatribacteriota bacterium]|nr:tyrosine-type recombinase/integrase [Candidatus Caldatribacteriota bacterium]
VVTALIDEFTEDMKLKKYAQMTIISYRANLMRFTYFLDENNITDARDVGLDDLNNYKKYMLEGGKKYSPETVHLRLSAVKRFFEYLERSNHLLINPSENLLLPKLGSRLPKNILTQEEVKTLLAGPNTGFKTGIRDRAILEVLYSVGLRLNECVNLQVYDVDTDGGNLRINKGKGNKDRIIPLGKSACRWVKEYLTHVRPKFDKKDERSLWLGQKGDKINPMWLNKILNKYAQTSGIKKRVTVHTFRRTFATHMLECGANPFYIQKILGHANSSTLNKYIKLVPKDLKRSHKKHHPRG